MVKSSLVIYLIYKTTNLINGKIYIGMHKQNNELFDGYYGSGKLLLHAIKKYGKENFIRETLFTFDSLREARDMEKMLVNIEFCKRFDTYNISEGGTGGNTMIGSDYFSKKNSIEKRKATKIKNGTFKISAKYIEKFRNNMKKNRIQPNNKGRIHSGEALKNMRNASENKRGKRMWITDGVNDVLIEKDKQFNLEVWKIGKSNKYFLGKKHNQRTKSKISNTLSGDSWYTNGSINLRVKTGEYPPSGFKRGMTQIHDKMWITNGIASKLIRKNELIADGWWKGRTFKRKNK